MPVTRGSFYVTEKIGPKQSMTPEGFLLCEEVPLARTGMMLYGPDETPIKAGPDGIVKVFREDDDVFNKVTIASAQGKPVTNDHPENDVTPDSWQELAQGIMMNVRRGESSMDDLLIGDLLITTPDGIKAVRSGKTEVSLGYEADYEQTDLGVGRQSNIIINHIALVEQGRCGPRCAISDKKSILNEGVTMAKKSKILDALMKAFKAKDAEEVAELAKTVEDEGLGEGEGEGGDTHIHIHAGGEENKGQGDFRTEDDEAPSLEEHIAQNAAEHEEMRAAIAELQKQIAALKGGTNDDETGTGDPDVTPEMIADEVPEEMQEEAAKAKDSAYLADSFQDTVAMAEILVPGIRIPTFDGSMKPGKGFKQICGLRRHALELAYSQTGTHAILDDLLGGKPLNTKTMTCDATRTLFRSAATVKRNSNMQQSRSSAVRDNNSQPKAPQTLADLNRINAEHWKNH